MDAADGVIDDTAKERLDFTRFKRTPTHEILFFSMCLCDLTRLLVCDKQMIVPVYEWKRRGNQVLHQQKAQNTVNTDLDFRILRVLWHSTRIFTQVAVKMNISCCT